MHAEILSTEQQTLLPYLALFRRSFYLVGGTAIALHIGHRQSIDFDLFTPRKISKVRVKQKLSQVPYRKVTLFEDADQLHLLVNGVKHTFFQYTYPVPHPITFGGVISVPSLLSLAAMKAFALGRRAKWKDYVDLYFILKTFFSVEEISLEAEKIFGDFFSEKLFRQQLAFHKDIDYSEQVKYLPSFQVPDDEVKAFLIDKSLEKI
jgi:hypothetical protein